MSDSGSIHITAESFSAHAQQVPLRWAVPMIEHMRKPEAGEYVWRRLLYAFPDLEDPARFAGAPNPLATDAADIVRRFIAPAERLAQTSLMAAEDRTQINIGDQDDTEEIVTDFSADDVTTGHMVFLRQCFSDQDEASFSRAKGGIERALHEAGQTDALAELKHWKKAHARLLNQTLDELVQERMINQGLMPAESVGPDGQTHSAIVRAPEAPKKLLESLWYGDQIHWGKHRDDLAVLRSDPLGNAMWEINARQAAVDLAHFYCGFAVLCQRALTNAAP